MQSHLRLLLAGLFCCLLAGCGVISEDDFVGCAPTGSAKTYRGVGCTRICKAEYRNKCASGTTADADKDCQCTASAGGGTGGGAGPVVVPDPIGASCVCYYSDNPSYVNLHLSGSCPQWLANITDGLKRTGIGRPIGSGEDSSCTNMCKSGGHELRGVFQFLTRGKGVCTQDALMFPGTILGEYVSGGELAESQVPEENPVLARADARLRRVNLRLNAAGLMPVTDVPTAAAPQFKMQQLGIDCRAECAKGGEMCAEFKVDQANTKGIVQSLARLPASGTATTIKVSELRDSAFGQVMTSCTHDSVAIDGSGRVQASGASCVQPLYFSFGNVKDFSAAITIPPAVRARYATAGPVQRLIFSENEAMLSLQLTPLTLHRLYGGRIRTAAADGDRLTLETQNSCLAINLKS